MTERPSYSSGSYAATSPILGEVLPDTHSLIPKMRESNSPPKIGGVRRSREGV